jgi:hypothetical protein
VRPAACGPKTLESVAEAKGGRSYVPIQLTRVTKAFAAIQEDLRSQYTVSHKPTAFKLDGYYRNIEIPRHWQNLAELAKVLADLSLILTPATDC